jgi:CAAX protease family protein
MINPVTEVREFVRAALADPAPDDTEPEPGLRRRRVVVGATLVVGTAVFAWAMRIEPGDSLFYVGTSLLAAVWAIGALLSGPLPLGWDRTAFGVGPGRVVVQALALGTLLLLLFLAGAIVVAQIPFLLEPVDELLEHSTAGSLPVVALITAVNGVAEELYFRGALSAAVGRRHAVLITTVVYAVVCATSGIALLAFAAAVLGVLVSLQRRVTGGLLGPTITHLLWSLGMLFLLPPALAAFS